MGEHPGYRPARDEHRGPDDERHGGEGQRLVEPVPQCQVLGLAAWIEGDGCRGNETVEQRRHDAGHDRQHAEHGSGNHEPESGAGGDGVPSRRRGCSGCGSHLLGPGPQPVGQHGQPHKKRAL